MIFAINSKHCGKFEADILDYIFFIISSHNIRSSKNYIFFKFIWIVELGNIFYKTQVPFTLFEIQSVYDNVIKMCNFENNRDSKKIQAVTIKTLMTVFLICLFIIGTIVTSIEAKENSDNPECTSM